MSVFTFQYIVCPPQHLNSHKECYAFTIVRIHETMPAHEKMTVRHVFSPQIRQAIQ